MMLSGSARLLELLDNPVAVEIPKGWKTSAEIAETTGVSTVTVLRHLRAGMKEGKVEKRVFLLDRKPVPFYLIHK